MSCESIVIRVLGVFLVSKNQSKISDLQFRPVIKYDLPLFEWTYISTSLFFQVLKAYFPDTFLTIASEANNNPYAAFSLHSASLTILTQLDFAGHDKSNVQQLPIAHYHFYVLVIKLQACFYSSSITFERR